MWNAKGPCPETLLSHHHIAIITSSTIASSPPPWRPLSQLKCYRSLPRDTPVPPPHRHHHKHRHHVVTPPSPSISQLQCYKSLPRDTPHRIITSITFTSSPPPSPQLSQLERYRSLHRDTPAPQHTCPSCARARATPEHVRDVAKCEPTCVVIRVRSTRVVFMRCMIAPRRLVDV